MTDEAFEREVQAAMEEIRWWWRSEYADPARMPQRIRNKFDARAIQEALRRLRIKLAA